MKMNNNVYGILGIGVKNSLWNAGWDHMPKTDGFGNIKGSSYALQYCLKQQWYNKGYRVLGIKTYQKNGMCSTLNQRYFDVFGEEDKKNKKKNVVQNVRNNLLSCKDVLNFGVAYTGENPVSIKGVAQFQDGINKFEDTNIIVEKILSPYKNPNNKNATTCSNGTKYTTDEAHYIYSFSLCPKEYDQYICDDFKGYQKEDYELLKRTSLMAVSNYNSKAKAGCKNEFAMFIEIKEENNYLLDLNNLQDYITVFKQDNKTIYDIILINDILNDLSNKIKNVEIYYNPRTLDIKGVTKNSMIKIYDLITRKEL